ncbi:hypothetical protein H257_12997 [Aphanomyces astaci]|uniref:DDE Tnp4 domain-containing protein n=1 Tax=Aphanomyces astaci TaxID=112090 RepID=W4FYI7_APHAT|nr:hypothetical protein H257_12997 [Aphanomyces astaci]ETV71864.1 hypothetical protein H257_12997 [Aphanomyces astaci]|eukprot:XP_009838713.1 hypothetical protein H257_12997 [Aphanomyces astaci]
MDKYCVAVHNKGSPLSCVFGFIGGTKVQTCRIAAVGDGLNLRKQLYTGHKRIHCLNYQAVAAPDGICIHFWGPTEGRRHDSAMLAHSGLLQAISSHPAIFASKYIFGDLAYGVTRHIISGYKGNIISIEKQNFDKAMSSVRQSVEWNFKIMKTLGVITFKYLANVRQAPVAKIRSASLAFDASGPRGLLAFLNFTLAVHFALLKITLAFFNFTFAIFLAFLQLTFKHELA